MSVNAINPILNFNGATEEAFNFYKSILGGEFATFMRWKDSPNCKDVPAQDQNKIMHVSLPIGRNNVLMGSDTPESMNKINTGNNFTICIDPGSEADADRIFNQLSAGGKVFMRLQKTFWDAYAGMFSDKFGIQWMINYSYKKQS
jgi:PhnB protein